MRFFIGFLVGALFADGLAKLVRLAQADMSPRTPESLAVDIVFNVAFAVWGLVLLVA